VPFDSERKCREYPIEILFCKVCNTAHQRFQVPKKELFTKDYHYRARMTGSVLVGMSDLVDNCEKRCGPLQGKSVLDVGCNDGSLLNFFAQKGCRTIGVEPTGAAADSSHRTLNAFFDRESALAVRAEIGEPDFITFTNVFAHIEDLAGLIANLRLLIGKNTVVVIENHYLGDIFRRGQFDTFYHEHPRTYSLKSFEFIAASLGLNLLAAQFVSRYGGNIRVFLGHGAPGKVEVDESHFGTAFADMAADLGRWRVQTRRMIEEHVAAEGKLRAKAFPGRAAILIKLLDLDESHLSAVYEIKGSIKVGHFVPGTRIPILPEAQLFDLDKTRPILNLAWHIPSEVRANLESHGYVGKVIDIKSV
jgi:SAM-dependent methyltransferase